MSVSYASKSFRTVTSNIYMDSKLNGIVDLGPVDYMKQSVFSLFAYFDTLDINFLLIHKIMTIYRILILYLPSMMLFSHNLWNKSSSSYNSVKIISSIAYFCSPETASGKALGFLWFYVAFYAFIGLFTLISAFNFKKDFYVSNFASYFLVFAFTTINLVLNPIIMIYLSLYISFNIQNHSMNIYSITLILVVVIIFLLNFWILNNVVTISLFFRPFSLQTVLRFPQGFIFVQTSVITLISVLFSQFSSTIEIIGCILVIAVYLSGIYVVFFRSSFIKSEDLTLYFASVLSSCLNLIIFLFTKITGFSSNEVIFVSYVLFLVLSYFISSALIRKKISSDLIVLDGIEDMETFDQNKVSVNKFIDFIITGCAYSHPVCISWKVFKVGVDVFQDYCDLWMVYAKFVAIYPTETELLSFILQSIISKKFKNHSSRLLIFFINLLLKKREFNISPELKSKLTWVQKSILKTKQRFRNIYDLMLQGSVSEMENSIENSYESLSSSEREINQLIDQYPNSRFVLRQLAMFVMDLKADNQLYLTILDKINHLKKGRPVSKDSAHVLGLLSFPLLPSKISNSKEMYNNINEQFSTVDTDFEGEDELKSKVSGVLQVSIHNHKMPAISCIKNSTLFRFVLLIILPMVFLILYFFVFVKDIVEPLEFIHSISYMRSIAFQLPAFLSRLMLEVLKNPSTDQVMCRIPSLEHLELKSFGEENTTILQIKYLLKEVMEISKKLSSLRTYHLENLNLNEARRIMFDSTVPFDFYMNSSLVYKSNVSAESFVIRCANQISQLLENDVSNQTLFSSGFLTMINNIEHPGRLMSDALQNSILYIREYDEMVQQLYSNIFYVLSTVNVIVFCISFIFEMKKLNYQKKLLFSSLTFLPKTTLSAISSSFRILKKENELSSKSMESDSELNKQEDNLIKVFNSIGDDNNRYSGYWKLLISNVLILFFSSFVWYLMSQMYKSKSTTLIESAPHLDNIMGSYGYMNQLFSYMNFIVLSTNGYPQVHNDPYSLIQKISKSREQVNKFYHLARFGGQNEREFPFYGIEEALQAAGILSGCSDQFAVPASAWGYYTCFNSDFQVYLFNVLLHRLVEPYKGNHSKILPRGQFLSEIWVIGIVSLYDLYFYPMFSGIIDKIENSLVQDVSMNIILCLTLFILCMILISIILNTLNFEEQKVKFAVSLLLHCPQSVIQQCSPIMQILGGKYHFENKHTILRSTEFYDRVVNNLTDCILVLNEGQIIVNVNDQCHKIFDGVVTKLIGSHVGDFFVESKLFGNSQMLLEKLDAQQFYYIDNDNTKVYYEFIRSPQSNFSILLGRNITQRVKYSELISEESTKVENMLSSILPKSLVKRVRSGENNISFLVQSASIVFIDIVEFTPWCAKNTSAYVMEILNGIFRGFDLIIQTLPNMTRIKCIGDCYMAAGGIFMETNQPGIHSKESIMFGLEALNVVKDINIKYKETLRIRIGIHTGGPIVAGVIGTRKPSFELLGNPISIAQKAEHFGVPNAIHITRLVYELVYGLNFKISEKGELETDTCKIQTYLVNQ